MGLRADQPVQDTSARPPGSIGGGGHRRVNPKLFDELAEVLARPELHRWMVLAYAEALAEALGGGDDLHPEPATVAQSVRDPDDDYLVALSEATKAMVVTGEDDLLAAGIDPPGASRLVNGVYAAHERPGLGPDVRHPARTSTTAWATSPATRCSSRSPSDSSRACGRATRSPGMAASIGIALSADEDDSLAEILDWADMAMYRARSDGRGRRR